MAQPPTSGAGSDAVRQDIRSFEATRQALRSVKSQLDALRDDSQRTNVLRQWSKLEGALMEGQEWTLPRSVAERRLVVIGSPVSCKTQVIQRFVYGHQPPPISCQDGRYKKEVTADGQSSLILLRDVTSSPSAQVCSWADGFVLVFSVCDELSFNLMASFHGRITDYCADRSSPVPIVMVGTQDAITDSKPRKVKSLEIHKLALDLGKLEYFEVNAIHGVNVERAFTEVIQHIAANGTQALSLRPTPTSAQAPQSSPPAPTIQVHSASPPAQAKKAKKKASRFQHAKSGSDIGNKASPLGTGRDIPVKQGFLNKRSSGLQKDWKRKYFTLTATDITYYPSMNDYMENENGKGLSVQHVSVKIPRTRPPPLPRQTSGSQTGTLTPSESDREQLPTSPVAFMPNSPTKAHGRYTYDVQNVTDASTSSSPLRMMEAESSDRENSRPSSSFAVNGDQDEGGVESEDGSAPRSRSSTASSSHNKKGHRRHKSWGLRDNESLGEEHTEFQIVSLNKCWTLEAQSYDERQAWTKAVEKQILASLEATQSTKASRGANTVAGATEEIRKVDGNDFCTDCVSPNPEWASLNFGSLLCIQCSAVHRQLGAHLSRVRSLALDEWSPELVEVMINIGNNTAREVYEASLTQKGHCRLPYSASREEREAFIQHKYVDKEFVAEWTVDAPLGEQLLDACQAEDISLVYTLLAHCSADDVNTHYGPGDGRTPLHVTSALGSVALTLLLIWNGADVNAEDSNGRIPLVYARTSKQTPCVDILLQNESRPDNSDDAPVYATEQRIPIDLLLGKYV